MTPRKRDAANEPPEYQPEEVEALTSKAAALLEELHQVMQEMAERLHALGAEPQ